MFSGLSEDRLNNSQNYLRSKYDRARHVLKFKQNSFQFAKTKIDQIHSNLQKQKLIKFASILIELKIQVVISKLRLVITVEISSFSQIEKKS